MRFIIVVVLAIVFAGCAATSAEKSVSDVYGQKAKNNESWASEYYKSGNERAEKYYRDESAVDRHNQIASSCGLFEIIFTIFINSDGCDTK